MMNTAVIAFGSNLENPTAQVQNALAAVVALPQIGSLKSSSLYRTAPVGYAEQPDFINAVALVETSYSAMELLQQLQQIEQQFGRQRSFRNAPRTLDLDIIDYARTASNTPELQLPHPRAHERSFVILPLAEIAPDYPIARFGTAQQLAAKLGDAGIEKIA
ncbi:2-amino-4-hydroxy-6-hydroxymethyldihydropteridine diphosphokinase [Kingella oralis]|jgi:hypothetical protein|uniref:2-amino-4-hydroxy-6- hydroxymethyldihydropteridine diphosphokinase n=1 Tax=Kingella oralis TaxID=505 RepID=UPI0034E38B62